MKKLYLKLLVIIILGLHNSASMLAQCTTSSGQPVPSHINVVIWPTQEFMDNFPSDDLARASALQRVNAGLSALNTLFAPKNTEFNLIFFPNSAVAPSQGTYDNTGYHILVRNQFDQMWPCVDADIIIVPTPGSAHGFGYNRVVNISDGYLNAPYRFAHEIGHTIGLKHLTGPCGAHCENWNTATFMCEFGGPIMQFTSCDLHTLSTDLYVPINCQQWMGVSDPLPDDFVCPPSPTIALATNQPYLIKNCQPDRSHPFYTLTVKGGQGGTNGLKVQVWYQKKVYDIDLPAMGIDFNHENSSDPNLNVLKIFENGAEKTFDLAEGEEKTFHFELLFNPDPGFEPNNTQVKVEAQLILSGSIISTKSDQRVYRTLTNETVEFLYTGDPVFVNGTLTLSPASNDILFLRTPSILVAPGGEIKIAPYRKVQTSALFTTSIEGCTNMWKGVVVSPGATFSAENLTLKDAQNAITVSKGGTLAAKNCAFINNNFGIRTGTAGSGNYTLTLMSNSFSTDEAGLRPAYNAQSPLPGSIGYAGLYLLDLASGVNIGINPVAQAPNLFERLQLGILAENSTVSIQNGLFKNMQFAVKPVGYPGPANVGKAIYANNSRLIAQGTETGNPSISFNDVHTGIWAEATSLTAHHCQMTNVHTGIYAYGGAINGYSISQNQIEAARQGIYVVGQSGLPYASNIDNNTITITESEYGFGIAARMNEYMAPYQTAIFSNQITLKKGAVGLVLTQSKNTRITQNQVFLNDPSAKPDGIRIAGGDNNIVNCNKVTGAGRIGIDGLMASRTDFICNEANGPNYGLYFDGVFTGAAPKIKLGDNKMFNNEGAGLHLGADALLGEQLHNGNRWASSGGMTVAEHSGGLSLAVLSRFVVDGNENAQYLPESVTPDGWFLDVQDKNTSFICTPGTDCPLPLAATEGELDRFTAGGLLTGFKHQGFSTWQAQKRLFGRLEYEGNPSESDPVISNFLATQRYTSVGQFATFAHNLEAMNSLPASELGAINDGEMQIIDNLNLLAQTERQLAMPGLPEKFKADLEVKWHDIRSQIEQRVNDLASREVAIRDSRSAIAQSLLQQNASLETRNSWEANEKEVSGIYLATIAQGILAFTPQQQNILETIANMCPLSEGEAVLRARSMLSLTNGSYEAYDETARCQANERGQENVVSDGLAQSQKVVVFPNPVNEELYVRYVNEEQKPMSFLLYNAVGQLVERLMCNQGKGTLSLPTGSLPEGVYFFKTTKGDSGKIIIQR